MKTRTVMESSNVVIDDTRLKSSKHEEEVIFGDDSPLEKVVVTPNVGKSNCKIRYLYWLDSIAKRSIFVLVVA